MLARILLTGNLEFVPLVQDVYQQRGQYEWLPMQEVSRSVNHSDNHSATHGTTQSTANTHTSVPSRMTLLTLRMAPPPTLAATRTTDHSAVRAAREPPTSALRRSIYASANPSDMA